MFSIHNLYEHFAIPSLVSCENGRISSTKFKLFFWQTISASSVHKTAIIGPYAPCMNSNADWEHCAMSTAVKIYQNTLVFELFHHFLTHPTPNIRIGRPFFLPIFTSARPPEGITIVLGHVDHWNGDPMVNYWGQIILKQQLLPINYYHLNKRILCLYSFSINRLFLI